MCRGRTGFRKRQPNKGRQAHRKDPAPARRPFRSCLCFTHLTTHQSHNYSSCTHHKTWSSEKNLPVYVGFARKTGSMTRYIPGRVEVDALMVLRRTSKLKSYKLNSVCNHFFGGEKDDVCGARARLLMDRKPSKPPIQQYHTASSSNQVLSTAHNTNHRERGTQGELNREPQQWLNRNQPPQLHRYTAVSRWMLLFLAAHADE